MAELNSADDEFEESIPLPGLRQLLAETPQLHPAHAVKVKDSREIAELIKHWDGKKVWALFEDNMWRQGSVIATIPNKAPGKPWVFILHTKHDVWRHVVLATPKDDTDLEFDTVQLTEYFDPSETEHHKPTTVDQFDDIVPAGTAADLLGSSCPVHPYIAAYIKRLRDIAKSAPDDIRNLKYALAQKERECDELSAHQNKMTVVLRDKHEEMKVLKEGYENAVEELKELRFSKEAFEISQGELGDRVSRLSGEVNAYKAENSQLLTQVASLSEQLSGYTASGVTNVEHAELQSKFDALKMMNEKLMGEEKQSRDRILALEEALQKTIVCDNEANHHRAQVHAAEISNLEYEIANLKRIFDAYRARQSSTPITHTIDTDPRVLLETVTRLITERDFAISEANRLENNARVAMEDAHYSQRQTAIQTDAVRNQSNTIAQLSARIRDLESGVKMTKSAKASTVDTGAITRLRNENEALKAKLSEVDFGSLLENLRKLSERCQSVELKLHMPAKGLSSLSESYDSETAGTETRAKHSQLANEVRGRIRELAERLADIEAKNKIAPSSDPNISRSSSFGSLSPAPIQKQNSGLFGKLGKKKSDLNELQGQITQLRAENAKLREDASSSALSPTIEGASDEQVQLLRKEVAEFERRLERIAVVTAAVLSSSSGNSSAQDQVKIHGLERDVLNLRGKLTSAMKKYQEDVQSIDSKVQPLQSENEQMRQRLAEYDEKMGKLSAENEKLRGTNIFSAFLPST